MPCEGCQKRQEATETSGPVSGVVSVVVNELFARAYALRAKLAREDYRGGAPKGWVPEPITEDPELTSAQKAAVRALPEPESYPPDLLDHRPPEER